MMRRHLVFGVVAVAGLCAGCDALFAQEEVAAKDFFSQDSRKVIYIEVGRGQTLVFDSADTGKYVLGGKPLEIRADEIEVRGDVVITSSPKKGADHLESAGVGQPGKVGGQGYGDGAGGGVGFQGDQGPQGGTAKDGDPARTARLSFRKVSGSGSLTIDDSGAKGGTGGEGGRGGLGGEGGHGANRDCNNGPGNGGNGGPGGVGGTGGVGGHGGSGGNIEINRAMCGYLTSKRLVLIVQGGSGGDGGIGGLGGDGGAGGQGGSGGCGGGGSNNSGVLPGASRVAERGQTGPKGPDGQDGKVRCVDCGKASCIVPPKAQVKKTN